MKNTILLFLVLLVSWNIKSQSNYNQTNLTNNDGLSNSSVINIFQDSRGVMWFGTWDGLNCYNSREFRVFKPEINNPQSISNNIIRSIIEEDTGNYLWIATDRGVDRLNLNSFTFDHYFVEPEISDSPVEHSFLTAKSSAGKIFVHFRLKGLFFFDEFQRQFVILKNSNNLDAKKMFFDVDDNLWILTNDNFLHKIIFKKGLLNSPHIENIITFDHIHGIRNVFFDPNKDEIWMQKESGILAIYNISKGITTDYVVSLPHDEILRSMLFFENHHIWGTNKGLYFHDLNLLKTNNIISNIQVLSLYKGTQQIIWVGTDMQGIWMLSPHSKNFLRNG